jgi:conjugal transfer/entry exclusion protein
MIRQSSDAQQYCGTQFLEAADDRQYCAAQLDLARNAHQQYAYSGRRYMPERRTRGIYRHTPKHQDRLSSRR